MGKIISIDFGLKRSGIAISDTSKTFAFPLSTIPSVSLMENLQSLFMKEEIDLIALGFPKRLNNTIFEIGENILELKKVLEKKFPDKSVVLVDERFTSKIASQVISQSGLSKKQKQKKSLVDKISATLILQSYIESESC
ncbi:MAG: Holliday junction resolvase RuvX [Crocinitomicaceae bacterium]|nr:Holliday junction resolvase RuvX [Crocinitomicaceae bacterium]